MTDLWPDDMELTPIASPLAVLREQAAFLAKKTGNRVVAVVPDPENVPSSTAPRQGMHSMQLLHKRSPGSITPTRRSPYVTISSCGQRSSPLTTIFGTR